MTIVPLSDFMFFQAQKIVQDLRQKQSILEDTLKSVHFRCGAAEEARRMLDLLLESERQQIDDVLFG
jgi:hypothetical protein